MYKAHACYLFLAVPLLLALSGCVTSVSVREIGPNEYYVTEDAGGMIGAALYVKPSLAELKDKADSVCVGGYDKLDEMTGIQYETEYIQWHIKCRLEKSR